MIDRFPRFWRWPSETLSPASLLCTWTACLRISLCQRLGYSSASQFPPVPPTSGVLEAYYRWWVHLGYILFRICWLSRHRVVSHSIESTCWSLRILPWEDYRPCANICTWNEVLTCIVDLFGEVSRLIRTVQQLQFVTIYSSQRSRCRCVRMWHRISYTFSSVFCLSNFMQCYDLEVAKFQLIVEHFVTTRGI